MNATDPVHKPRQPLVTASEESIDAARENLSRDQKRARLRAIIDLDVLHFIDANGAFKLEEMRAAGIGRMIRKIKATIRQTAQGPERSIQLEFEPRLKAMELDARLAGEMDEPPPPPERHVSTEDFAAALRRSPEARKSLRRQLEKAEAGAAEDERERMLKSQRGI